MTSNRSVPVDTILPHIVYRDVVEAIDWLTRVLGFAEHYRYGDPHQPNGAQMRFGDVYFMLRQARPGSDTPAQLGAATQSLTVFVRDLDAHFAKAKAEGANIVEDLNVTIYGERQCGVVDFAGHHWLFAEHARDVSPEEWGARIAGR
jgi:uncharacterized glyoxalase superfamily protein PhnB